MQKYKIGTHHQRCGWLTRNWSQLSSVINTVDFSYLTSNVLKVISCLDFVAGYQLFYHLIESTEVEEKIEDLKEFEALNFIIKGKNDAELDLIQSSKIPFHCLMF